MRIYIGADHRGVKLKSRIVPFLKKQGYDVVDLGAFKDDVSCDYPKLSLKVGEAVANTKGSRGVLVCMTGIGHSMAANKVPGVLAALCYNKQAARLSREHNNANVLVVSAKFISPKDIEDIIDVWLKAHFEGGRHLRRVNQIRKIEEKYSK
jgi:ribose 5-phosphate isomerase B